MQGALIATARTDRFVALGLRRKSHPTRSRQNTIVRSSLFPLPLFSSNKVLLPTDTGLITVFEPRYLQMFRDMQDKAITKADLRFGHILSASIPVDANLESPMPKVGVAAQVKNIAQREDGTLLVEYEGTRRFKILNMWQLTPYATACASWYEDCTPPHLHESVASIEQDLHKLLLDVAKLNRTLDTGAQLPESVGKYAPPPPRRRTSVDYLIESGHPAGDSIAMWLRSGSPPGSKASVKKPSATDPYQSMFDELCAENRQELFSFAAASMLELGMAERSALLCSTDAGARMEWISTAVRSYRDDLAARASLKTALPQVQQELPGTSPPR